MGLHNIFNMGLSSVFVSKQDNIPVRILFDKLIDVFTVYLAQNFTLTLVKSQVFTQD